MSSKYELLDECIDVGGHTLYRIRALRSFSYIKTGDLGGFIESENNLSYDDGCWVYEHAWVHEHAWVYGNAQIYGHAHIAGASRVGGNAWVGGRVNICKRARVSGNAHVSGNARVGGKAWVCGDAYIDSMYHPAIAGTTIIDHGVWTQKMKIDGKCYMISHTLEKILVG